MTAMSTPRRQDAFQSLDRVLSQIEENARLEDETGGGIAASVALLHQNDLLNGVERLTPQELARLLMRIGGANLSLGRLLEGHVNALQLIDTYGTPQTYRRACQLVAAGGFCGVWGADDTDPVAVDDATDTLSGRKKFASGLGVVSHALVPVGTGSESRMAFIDVSDASRADPSSWQMPGMRATISGTYDFSGILTEDISWIGNSGDYTVEPHFVGGVWRIAALQIGGAIGLLATAADELRALDRLGAEAQKIRLGALAMSTLSGTSLVLKAASGPFQSHAQQVAQAIAARIKTEEIALSIIAGVQQSVGLGHFQPHSESHRKARDLSVYLRQAARDAMLMQFAEVSLRSSADMWQMML